MYYQLTFSSIPERNFSLACVSKILEHLFCHQGSRWKLPFWRRNDFNFNDSMMTISKKVTWSWALFGMIQKLKIWAFYWFMNCIYEIKFRKIICYEIITTHIVLSTLMWLHSLHISLKVPNSYDHLNWLYSFSKCTCIVWIELESK